MKTKIVILLFEQIRKGYLLISVRLINHNKTLDDNLLTFSDAENELTLEEKYRMVVSSSSQQQKNNIMTEHRSKKYTFFPLEHLTDQII